MKIRTIIFDFQGVLCHDFFYVTDDPRSKAIRGYFEKEILFSDNPEIIDSWMRGKIDKFKVNHIISRALGIPIDTIDTILEESVYNMRVDKRLLDLIGKLRAIGIKAALASDNMEVFDEIIVPNRKLDKHFDLIVNSFQTGLLKRDNNGEIFDHIIEKLNGNYSNALLVDDSHRSRAAFQAKGGRTYEFKKADEFISWFDDNLEF